MRKENFFNIILFVVFFGVGLGAVYISFISNELIVHLENRRILADEEKKLAVLDSLIEDYQYSLEQVKTDPNYADKLAPSVLGIDRPDPNMLYPQFNDEQLEKAKQVLAETMGDPNDQIPTPKWLLRCNEKVNHWLLGVSGACLVVISLTWFVWVSNQSEKGKKS